MFQRKKSHKAEEGSIQKGEASNVGEQKGLRHESIGGGESRQGRKKLLTTRGEFSMIQEDRELNYDLRGG